MINDIALKNIKYIFDFASKNIRTPINDDDVCAICFDIHDETTIETDCKHQFHEVCMNRIKSSNCPLCFRINKYDVYIKQKN